MSRLRIHGLARLLALLAASLPPALSAAEPEQAMPAGATEGVAETRLPALNSLDIPDPNLSVLEPEVAEQLRKARASLEALVGGGGAKKDLVRGYGELGRLYQAYELHRAAEACYRAALSLDPDNFDWVYYLAYLYQTLGRADETAEYYARAKALRPDSPLVRVRLGDVQMFLGRVEQAKREYLEALYLKPRATAIIARIGEVALAEKRYELAVQYLSVAVESQPEANRLHYMLGMAYRGLGDDERARAALAASGPVGVQPPDPYVDELKALVLGERLYVIRGKLAYSAGQYAAAAEAFGKAVAANPQSAGARIDLGSSLVALGREAEAIDHYREAIDLDPENLTARFNLGQLLLDRGEAGEAVEHLEAVVQGEEQDAQAHYFLAGAYEASGRVELAMEYYRKAVVLDPTLENGWLRGTRLLLIQGRQEKALDVLETAHKRLPASGRLAEALARMLAGAPDPALRDGDRALALALEAFQARPIFPYAETLAMAYAETGDCEQAVSWQQRAVDTAVAAGLEDAPLTASMQATLEHYRTGRPCRFPLSAQLGQAPP